MSAFDPKRTLVIQICRDAASAGTLGTDTRYAALLEGLQQLGWTVGSLPDSCDMVSGALRIVCPVRRRGQLNLLDVLQAGHIQIRAFRL